MAYDPATVAYVNAMTVAPTTARENLIDALIVGLKSDGLWAKLDKLFLLAAHDNQAGRVNAIDPTKVAIVNGTPTFTTDGGYAGDGTATSYLDFAGPFSFGGNFSQNSATIGCFITVQGNTGNHRIMGDSATISLLSARTDGSGEAAFVNSATSGRTLPHLGTTKVGHRTVVRTSASANSIYFNGSLQGTNTNGSVTPSAVNGTLLQVGGQGGSTDTVSFAYSGGALTATDVSNLDARLNTYLNGLKASSGSATGSATVSGVGSAKDTGVGSATGSGAAAGVGKATDKGIGSSAGAGTASGIGKAQNKGSASSAGTSAVSGVGKAKATANGTSAGVATVTGRSNGAVSGSSAGVATVSGVGGAQDKGSGASSGAATVAGKGLTGLKGLGSSTGVASISGQGKARFTGKGSSAGLAVLSAIGAARSVGVGAVIGTATVNGVPAGVVLKTYPLANIAQTYPLTSDQTYPLAGLRQSYPGGNW